MPKIEVTNCYIKAKPDDPSNPFTGDPIVLDSYAIIPRDEFYGEPLPEMPTEYAWAIKGAEHCEGPFPSKKEAVEDAKGEYGDMPGTVIVIGKVRYADPVHYVPTDLDDIMERMDENAFDNEFGFYEGEIFDAKKGAKEALEKVLTDWARTFVSSTVWTLDTEEEITL